MLTSPGAGDGSHAAGWGGRNQRASVQHGAPQTHRTLSPPVFPSHTAAAIPVCKRGSPTPSHLGDLRDAPHWDAKGPAGFVGFLAEAARGGCFGLISKRNVYVRGGQEGGEEKHHSSALGKREIVLKATAVIADKRRSHQITRTLIQNRKALNNQCLAPRYGKETLIHFGRAQNFPLSPRLEVQSAQTSTAAPHKGAGAFVRCPPRQTPFPTPSLTHFS